MQVDAAPVSSDTDAQRSSSRILVAIISVMAIAMLRIGRMLVLPIVISMMLTLTLGAGVGAATLLASPAMEWVASAPKTIN